MFCKINWNNEFVHNNFEKKYINNDYKDHRENILYEIELSMLPATQPYVEKQLKVEEIRSEIDILYEEKRNLDIKINNKHNEIVKINNSDTVERKRYVRKCPKNDCQGFLSSQLKCELCSSWVCSECREIKGTDKNTEHECNKEILESVKLLNNDTKPCPKCSSMIYKIEGCSQMFCTECHTAFNWNTLRIDTGVVHNPHYFEWLRQNNNGNTERNPNEILCGRELDRNFITTIRITYINKFNESITKDRLLLDIINVLSQDRNTEFSVNIIKNIKTPTIRRLVINSENNNIYLYGSVIIDYVIDSYTTQLLVSEAYSDNCQSIITKIKKLNICYFMERIRVLERIIQKTIHITHYEIPRQNIDRINNNLELRIAYMRNQINADYFKTTVQRRDKEIQRRTEHSGILRMYISCITDLLYRLNDNPDNYDNILSEMNELRKYTNVCVIQVFKMFGSQMKHHIDSNFTYNYTKESDSTAST